METLNKVQRTDETTNFDPSEDRTADREAQSISAAPARRCCLAWRLLEDSCCGIRLDRSDFSRIPRLAADLPALIGRECVAVLAGDVVGYSRLIELDAMKTAMRIRAMRRYLVGPLGVVFGASIARHAGDGVLMTFADPRQAVGCALGIQRSLLHLERFDPAPYRLRLRVGLSMGEVIMDGEDFHGQSVIVASRLQSLAEPGGILMCGAIHHAVQPWLSAPSEALGHWSLKNLAGPVPVHRIRAVHLRV